VPFIIVAAMPPYMLFDNPYSAGTMFWPSYLSPEELMIWKLRIRRIFQLDYISVTISSFLWVGVLFGRISDSDRVTLFVTLLVCLTGRIRPGEGLRALWLIRESSLRRMNETVKKDN
jgi:hypothetical protein